MSLFNEFSIGGGRFVVASIFFASLPMCALAAAAPKSSLDEVFHSLNSVHDFREVSVSPDGKRVAWVEELREPNGAASSRSAIYVATFSAQASPVRITALSAGGACEEHDVTWSPDGRALAFLSDAKTPKQLQLFTALATGGPARKLTRTE
jgi:Tol biopolymer transport system component